MLREIELFEALRRDDLSTVMSSQYQRVLKYLLREDTPEFLLPNPSSLMFYRHVLHFAAAGGNLEIFQKLMIKAMPNINDEVDQYKNTPLHYAAKYGRVSIVRLLCSHGVEVMCKNNDGFLPSHYAAICGSLPIIQILHHNGDPLNHINENKWTPLHYAIKYQHHHLIEYLMQIDSLFTPPLVEKVPDSFLRTLYSPNSYDIAATLVQLASTYGSINLIELIINKIDNFESVNHNGWNLLHFAAANGIKEVFPCVHRLMKSDDIFFVTDRNNRNLAHLAAISDHLDVLVALDELNITLYNERDRFAI